MTNTTSKYRFGMDWLNGVLPVQDVDKLFSVLAEFSSKLRFDRWQLVNSGLYNYKRRFILDGKFFIQLMYNPVSDEELFTACQNADDTKEDYNNNGYVFFSISGDGIRYLHSIGGEQSALNKLLYYFYHNKFKASRFDTYCDILDEDNTIVPLIQEAFSYVGREQIGKPFLKTRLRRNHFKPDGSKDCKSTRKNFQSWTALDDNGNEFTNCQLGHHASTVGMFRCYNKLIELHDSRLSDVASEIASLYQAENYWYRLEYEMHKENAAACFNALMQSAEENNNILTFEDIFASCFEKVFSIVMPTCVTDLRSERKATECSAWSDFRANQLANTEYFVQFGGVPYVPYSLKRFDKHRQNIKSYAYALILRIACMSDGEQHLFLEEARSAFFSKKRYNPLIDELKELPNYNPYFRISSLNKVSA